MEPRDKGLPCGFATLFTRNVHHILENIFLCLDTESLKSCLEVCQAWQDFLASESFQKKKSRAHLNLWMDTDNLKHQLWSRDDHSGHSFNFYGPKWTTNSHEVAFFSGGKNLHFIGKQWKKEQVWPFFGCCTECWSEGRARLGVFRATMARKSRNLALP